MEEEGLTRISFQKYEKKVDSLDGPELRSRATRISTESGSPLSHSIMIIILEISITCLASRSSSSSDMSKTVKSTYVRSYSFLRVENLIQKRFDEARKKSSTMNLKLPSKIPDREKKVWSSRKSIFTG